MSSATSATTGVAGRYASALFELADSARSLDQVAQDLTTFRTMVGSSPDLARLLVSPVIGRDLKSKTLLAVLDAAGIKGLTRSFIGTVAVNPIRICGGSGSGTSPRRCGLRKTRSPLHTCVTLSPAAITRAIALVPGTNGNGGRL